MRNPRSSATDRPTKRLMTGRRKGVWIILLLAIIGLTAATIYTTQQRALAADKARFVQAEKDVDDISARIIAATGQPLKVDKRKYCSRPNLKFEEGRLSCYIIKDFFYGVASHVGASVLQVKIKSIASEKWKYSHSNYSDFSSRLNLLFTKTETTEPKSLKLIETYRATESKMDCSVIYNVYDKKSSLQNKSIVTTSEEFIVASSLLCSDYTKQASYTLK